MKSKHIKSMESIKRDFTEFAPSPKTTKPPRRIGVIAVLNFLLILIVISFFIHTQYKPIRKIGHDVKEWTVTQFFTLMSYPSDPIPIIRYTDDAAYVYYKGDVSKWPMAQTYSFTSNTPEGDPKDRSIKVRFKDGSTAKISGSVNVIIPIDEHSFKRTMEIYTNYKDFLSHGVIRIVKNSLRLTANLMTARESYAGNRPEFIKWAADQIQNGIYVTEYMKYLIQDPTTGKLETRHARRIKMDKHGRIARIRPLLMNTGVRLEAVEITSIEYDDRFKKLISEQLNHLMKISKRKDELERLLELDKEKAVMQ